MRGAIGEMDTQHHARSAQTVQLELEMKRMRSINEQNMANYQKLVEENKAYENEIAKYQKNLAWMQQKAAEYEESLKTAASQYEEARHAKEDLIDTLASEEVRAVYQSPCL